MSHDAARRFVYAFLLATAVASVVSWRRPAAPSVAPGIAAEPRHCPSTG